MSKRKSSFWTFSAAEGRVALLAVALTLWATVLLLVKRAVPFPDFLCPYTMGNLVHEPTRLYDVQAFHATQVSLVPASTSLFYPPVYPPQLAVAMAPFSIFPFVTAATIWTVITIVLYGIVAVGTFRATKTRLDAGLAGLAAIAFPPFVDVVAYGQNTVVLLACCFLAWRALDSDRKFLAGMALGAFALKPQLALPWVAVVLAGGEWRMLGGALFSVGVQAGLVWVVMGSSAFAGYIDLIPEIIRNANGLEAVSGRSHSLRTLTQLLPGSVGQPLWLGLVIGTLWQVGRIWRSNAPLNVRMGVAMVAAVLTSPHLIAYDATLLTLPLFWFADWLWLRKSGGPLRLAVLLLFLAFALPLGRFIPLQPTVLLLSWIGTIVWRAVQQELLSAHQRVNTPHPS
jgi:alpha-1,2-mannosyltransferase